jgi:adenosine deaminase
VQAPELANRIRRMPKAELHLHFEGALRWSTVRELNPQAKSLVSAPWLGKPFASFEEFRDIFRNFLIPASGTEERIERLMFEVLEDLAVQNVRYAEPIVYPPFHMTQGLSVRQVFGAVQHAILRAERQYGVVCRLIIGLNRGREAGQQAELAHEALEMKNPDGARLVAGLDVMSDDRFGIQPEFVDLYREVKRLGLRLKVHAGEMGGPTIVRDALEKLEPRHLSHGVRASEDEKLLRELAAAGTWFHVCPTSNVLLGAARDYANHPIKQLLDAECNVTLNSDDPILFGASITDEYLHAAFDMGFSQNQIKRLAMNGFTASLLPEADGARFMREIELLFDGA